MAFRWLDKVCIPEAATTHEALAAVDYERANEVDAAHFAAP